MDLTNKVALITGGSRGIGKEIAKTLAKEGVKTIITYKKSEKEAEKVLKEIRKYSESFAIKSDLSKINEIENCVQKSYNIYNQIDFLVNNAAIYFRTKFFDSTERTWDETFNTNLKGPYFLTKYIAEKMMVQNKGMIINISSDVILKGNSGGLEYGISKSGLFYFTTCLAEAIKPIKVNCVLPGYTDTDMSKWKNNISLKKKIEKTHGKVNEPSDVAKAVLLLMNSEKTGETILVRNRQLKKLVYSSPSEIICKIK